MRFASWPILIYFTTWSPTDEEIWTCINTQLSHLTNHGIHIAGKAASEVIRGSYPTTATISPHIQGLKHFYGLARYGSLCILTSTSPMLLTPRPYGSIAFRNTTGALIPLTPFTGRGLVEPANREPIPNSCIQVNSCMDGYWLTMWWAATPVSPNALGAVSRMKLQITCSIALTRGWPKQGQRVCRLSVISSYGQALPVPFQIRLSNSYNHTLRTGLLIQTIISPKRHTSHKCQLAIIYFFGDTYPLNGFTFYDISVMTARNMFLPILSFTYGMSSSNVSGMPGTIFYIGLRTRLQPRWRLVWMTSYCGIWQIVGMHYLAPIND